ncbi:MAG: molybdopterin-dependent oxidoreductase [Rhodothermales bacterium]|nr:molybdopterin-dependent oxidoreductase [Rhodothermales bacterium]MBO6778636.1 molybdopterin-dependent oxidoreductase [Rhodothermales bacterium]
MKNIDGALHVRGEAEFVDDERRPVDLAFAAVCGSPVAHGRLKQIDVAEAEDMEGVLAVVLAADLPGDNEVGPIIQDEPLLASTLVRYIGHPVALVVADTATRAREAAAAIDLSIEELPPVVDPRRAFEAGEIIGSTRTFECGEPDGAWQSCAFVAEGRCDLGGQEHVYLETQRARATPLEHGRLHVSTSTQSPYAAQKHIAKVLGVPNNHIEVDVRRLGGGFGGKEDQATHWACFAAVGAWASGRPVEIVLRRDEDFRHTGKRHPYSADFKLGADEEGRIVVFEALHYQNAGATADLSPGVLERTLYHATGSYRVPNARLFAASCRTNIPPNTAFRGFGGPQGMFVIEAALARLSEVSGIPRATLQERNLLRPGDVFPYGQPVEDNRTRRAWHRAVQRFRLEERLAAAETFNAQHFAVKKGVAVMPVTFGISFTTTFLNQAGALVHVYTDGSVSVTTGGVEMGQGLTTNIALTVAKAFGIDPSRVRVETTNTTRVANMSPSAASSTTLLNGNAALEACRQIRERLLRVGAGLVETDLSTLDIKADRLLKDGLPTDIAWEDLVAAAYLKRIDLSAHGFFATPGIHFDKVQETGHPFAYHAGGTAIVEVTLDCLRGRYAIDAVRIVHDVGRPLSRTVDLGQVEGGLAQGLGWMTVEDLQYDDRGRLMSKNLASYKVPDAFFMSDTLEVEFLDDADEVLGPFGSKAVGEPPLMYGIGVFFALREAMRAFAPEARLPFHAPLTPERVLMGIHARVAAELSA